MAFIDTELRPQGEVQQVGRIRLSEAIRIGARIRPKCTGVFFRNGGSCAMGAAMEANGLPYFEGLGNRQEAVDMFPSLFVNMMKYTQLAKEISERNDRGESRESIAAWLESIGL
jgi:hypothetical protein